MEALADALEVTEVLRARPARLSGGQRQRVALGRVLAAAPRVLLLDEPFVGLDPALVLRVAALVVSEQRAAGVPCLLVTHDLSEAQRWGDQVAVVDGGRCLQVDAPDAVVRRPASRQVAGLVGYRAFVSPSAFGRGAGAPPPAPRPSACTLTPWWWQRRLRARHPMARSWRERPPRCTPRGRAGQ